MAAPSCSSLPEWPTISQLENAGYITDVDVATIVMGVLFGVCGFLSFLPQIISFIQVRSVQGSSGLTIAFSMLSTNLQWAAITAAGSPREYACASLSPWACFTNTLAIQQILLQAIGATAVFVAYFYYWRLKISLPDDSEACVVPGSQVEGSFASAASVAVEAVGELGGHRGRMAAVGVSSVVMSIVGLIGAAAVAFTAGPCSAQTLQTQDLLGGIATVVQFLVWLPQILLLCSTRDPGSLSVLGVAIQGVGGLIFVVDLAFEQAQLVSILPFVAVLVECGLILVMVWYYSRQRSQRRRLELMAS